MLDTNPHQTKQTKLGDITINYRVSGPENDRAPLVLVHGTAGSIDGHFGYLFPMMAFRQRVIALDFSDPGGDKLELADLVAQVRAVIEAECPDQPVSLLGYSLGAVVAAKAAIELGDKIANLMLVAGWMKTDTHQALRNHVWQKLRDQGSDAITEYMTVLAFSPNFMRAQTFEGMVEAAKMLKLTPFVDKQMELNTRIDIAAEAETIKARTLIVAGTYDVMVPKYHSKALFGAIEDARYTEIPSGHAIVHERAAELFYHIDGFTRDPGAYAAGTIIPAQKP
jgi:pimeloyl-ACP methyl ester carboxylesterase